MAKNHSPHITSFVIRFIHDQPESKQEIPSFRGTVHHVQSNQEIPFTNWRDAVEFIQRFVPLNFDDLEIDIPEEES